MLSAPNASIFKLQCSAYAASASSETTWTMRTTFPEYVVALATIVGSVLFTVHLISLRFWHGFASWKTLRSFIFHVDLISRHGLYSPLCSNWFFFALLLEEF